MVRRVSQIGRTETSAMNNHKKMWYIWLSFFAFGVLWFDTAVRIILSKNQGGLLGHALKNLFQLSIVFIALPMILIVIVASALLSIIPNLFSINISEVMAGNILVVIVLFLMYFPGVFVAYQHALWRKENIPSLIKDGEQSQIGSDEQNGL